MVVITVCQHEPLDDEIFPAFCWSTLTVYNNNSPPTVATLILCRLPPQIEGAWQDAKNLCRTIGYDRDEGLRCVSELSTHCRAGFT